MQEEQAENVNTDATPAADAQGNAANESKREMSSISFPYGDLDHAIDFAKAIREVGGQGCLIEQLAGFLQVAASGGSFQARLAYSRKFGLIEVERGKVRLTPIGLRIVDASQEAAARVDAFLAVPLYQKIYEKYKAYTLPPAAALEREMLGLGVSSKQTGKARQAFDRSAKQAGFFWAGADRLTLPVVKSFPETRPIDDKPPPPSPPPPPSGNELNGGGGGGGSYHPFIEGLLKTLPRVGEEWPIRDRAKWLKLAANAFDLIYKGDGDIEIKAIANTKPATA